MNVCMYVYVRIYIYVCMCMCVCLCVHACMHQEILHDSVIMLADLSGKQKVVFLPDIELFLTEKYSYNRFHGFAIFRRALQLHPLS